MLRRMYLKWSYQKNFKSNLISEHKGPHQLKFNVFDPDESVYVDFLSRSYKVRISKQLMSDIGTLIDFSYKLN